MRSRIRPRMTEKFTKLDRLITQEALAIEAEEAFEAGHVTFLAKTLVQCTLPHRDPGSLQYQRTNGRYKLTILSPPEIGIPWGRYPRLLLPWLTTEALRTHSSRIKLGPSLSKFMLDVGVRPHGGSNGTIARFRDQAVRLFSSTFVGHYSAPDEVHIVKLAVASESRIWWKPGDAGRIPLWNSYVELTGDFYSAVTDHPVPLDIRALRALPAPLAIDLYAWLTFRMSYLRSPITVPWPLLAFQFGSSYSSVKHFRAEVVKQLRRIVRLYPALRIQVKSQGLTLHPSPTHIRRRT